MIGGPIVMTGGGKVIRGGPIVITGGLAVMTGGPIVIVGARLKSASN